MLMDMSHSETAAGTVVVTLAGKIMMGSESEQIVTLIEDVLRRGKRNVVFDVAGVARIDSTGVGRFISSYNKIKAVGGEMRIAGAAGQLYAALHASRLDTIFPLYPSVEQACQG